MRSIKQVYQTTDDEIHESKHDATVHQARLDLQEFLCETLHFSHVDSSAIVEMLADNQSWREKFKSLLDDAEIKL
jgi:hypothetical protein